MTSKIDPVKLEAAIVETNRLTRELDITNPDHIALWLEANKDDSPLGWLACRIAEAHEAVLANVLENPPKHKFWAAGEPDCPPDIKAGNGELHTLRCKVCGEEDARNSICRVARTTHPDTSAQPVKMLLFCPKCGLKHIDAPDERTPEWDNPAHKSHLCHGCGCIWRPADIPTEGVEKIETMGKADTWTPPRAFLTYPDVTPAQPVGDVERLGASAEAFLAKVASLAETIGWQAGVGGMETAGALISYLARFPAQLPAFMADDFSIIMGGFPHDWLVQGCLTWHARDGKVTRPEYVRRAKCPSCHGLNTSCPDGCGRDPETGELNGTRLDWCGEFQPAVKAYLEGNRDD